jgi:Xaa-Pro aminopeptidase
MFMFSSFTYTIRRDNLLSQINSGLILMLGNDAIPMNYSDNTYRFRQDSTFLYYFGLDMPGLAAVIDTESKDAIIFGDDPDLDDIIWMGPQCSLIDQAKQVGVSNTQPSNNLNKVINDAIRDNWVIHFLKPYREKQFYTLTSLLGIKKENISTAVSNELIAAIIEQRSIKSAEEIEEIEKAHAITYDMHTTAMRMARAGIYERDIAGTIEGIALSAGASVAFQVILSIRGEILHNTHYGNLLGDGDLIINDSGAETVMHYAADITRTFPVSGKFTDRQRDVYEIVLKSQVEAIQAVKPGQNNKDIHLQTAKVITEGLQNLGIMKGDSEDAVQMGAHALFFPHGLGHMLGLDVHDMENLGEDNVGYNNELKRSEQFGLASLRFAKNLQAGNVITIEPGIYFIPELIKKWKNEKKHTDFINYDQVEKYINFGGIRIEDNVVVTDNGYRVIGKSIPKTVAEIEKICQE